MFAEVVGVGCVLDGVRYTNGQSFQPNCKYNCTCVDGAVGCTPLCLRARPPRLWCHRPRRVSIPGRCCQQWVCDHDARRPRKTTQRHTSALGGCEELEVRAQEGVAIGGGRGGRGEGGALTLYDWHASAMTPSPQTSAH